MIHLEYVLIHFHKGKKRREKLKLNKNIQWLKHKEVGYFKVGSRIVAVHDLDLSLQEKYWDLLQSHLLEELEEKFYKDETFNQYISFVRMLGGFYDESNWWTAYNKEYSLQLNNTDNIIKDLKIKSLRR